MKKLLLFLFTFGLLISTSVRAEIVLYCNEELGTGFIKKMGFGARGILNLIDIQSGLVMIILK